MRICLGADDELRLPATKMKNSVVVFREPWKGQFGGCVAHPLQTIIASLSSSNWSLLLRNVMSDAMGEVLNVYFHLKKNACG